ncbi:MAG: fasciclin domain-containing protein, partial [Candidatus Thermoplasmatota archaeon]|nr:fasciclin domain-containing protein [Candidatus Thermoplasmatota archaeon]
TLLKEIQSSHDYKTLLRAFQKSGILNLLQTNGPYTLFAPNDVAFAKYPTENIEVLLNDKNRLTTILKTHLINKQITISQLATTKKVKTLNGKELLISKNGFEIEKAKILPGEIQCSNGIIHKIDSILTFK